MTTAAEQKNREEIERQVLLLQETYAELDVVVVLDLKIEHVKSHEYNRSNYTLSIADSGKELTYWTHASSVEVWLSLSDMRRALRLVIDRQVP